MKDFKQLSAYTSIAREYPYYRADVFAACLRAAGVDPDQIVISRRRATDQGFLHDMEYVSVKYPLQDPDSPYIEIVSGREGICDSLPEELFYAPDRSGQEQDKDYIVKRIKENRRREGLVRDFLRLFEAESDNFLYRLQREELNYDRRHIYREFTALFGRHWPLLSLLSRSEQLRFLQVSPYFSSLRGDYAAVSAAVTFILNLSITFRREESAGRIPVSSAPRLEQIRLGRNFVLCPEVGSETDHATVITATVSGVDTAACTRFFGDRDRAKILHGLSTFFFEIDEPLRIRFVPDRECCGFILDDSEKGAWLGVNTYL